MTRLPPGPSGALRQSIAYASDPYGYSTAMKCRYGDPFTMPMPTGPVVVCAHPEAARTIFTARPDIFDIWAKEQLVPVFGADSIFTVIGDAHRRHRQAIVEASKHRGALATICRERVADLEAGQTISMANFFLSLSLEVILDVVFGARGDDSLRQLLGDYVDVSGRTSLALPLCYSWLRRSLYPGWGHFLRLRDRLRDNLQAFVMERQANDMARPDMLTVLSRHLDTQAAIDDLLTMLIAGHETTARALAFAVDHLAYSPKVLETLQNEIGGAGEESTIVEIGALPYLDSVVEETLRLHPVVVQVTRALREPLDVLGHVLPAGISVAISAHLVHRRADLHSEPDVFRPERFLERRPSPFEHFPFGGGPTRCPGASLAKDEMKMVLFHLLRRFNLEPKRKTVCRAVVKGLVMAPHDDVVMSLVRR